MTRLEEAREYLRRGLALAREVEYQSPHEVADLVAALVADLRSWHPETVAPLGVLPPPTGPTHDPRELVVEYEPGYEPPPRRAA